MSSLYSRKIFSLKTKILLLLLAVFCTILGSGGLYLKKHFRLEIERHIKQRATGIANTASHFVRISGNSPSLDRLINLMGKEENIGVIAIVSGSDPFDLLVAGGSKVNTSSMTLETITGVFEESHLLLNVIKTQSSISRLFKNVNDNNYNYVHIFPIQIQDSHTEKFTQGSIYVQLETAEQMVHLDGDVGRALLGMLLGLLVLIGIQYVVLHHHIFTPINILKQTMERRSQGDTSVHATHLHQDEIGEVGEVLNVMLDTLDSRTQDLADEKNRLQTIMDSMFEGIIIIDQHGEIQSVNRGAEQMFGYHSDELIGTNIKILMPEMDAHEHDAHLKNYTRTQTARIIGKNRELSGQRKNREIFPMTIYVKNVTIHNQVQFIGLIRDISEQRARERELEEARNAAIEANTLKSQFLANISHELRTPMHSIITFSRQGIERIQKWTLAEHEENLSLIHNSGKRLLLLINDLLDLSKLEAGAVTYHIKENQLNPIIQAAIRNLRSLMNEKSLRVEYVNEHVPVVVQCDAEKITQVVINLLSNAIKFTAAGSCIRVETTPGNNGQENALLTVADEGIGIPENELERIFDKFIQSSKTKTSAGGTGLGLAICREIIVGHGGKIWAENRASGGTKFSVQLPVTQQRRA